VVERCTRCVLPSFYPQLTPGADGVCRYCAEYDAQWKGHDFEASRRKFEEILTAAKTRARKRGQKYDCLVPLSGGLDSSYTLYLVRSVYQLNPLAVNYDNGFQTELARENIRRITTALDVDLKVVAPDKELLKELYRVFLFAGAELCTPCELGGTGAIYKTAYDEGLRLIIFGTSERTEGISPKAVHYFDVRYFKDVVRGKVARSRIDDFFFFPSLLRMAYLQLFVGIKVIQTPYYLPWPEDEIRELLSSKFGWESGDKPHADCFFFPLRDYIRFRHWKFGMRTQRLSALVRDGQLDRDEALRVVEEEEGQIDPEDMNRCLTHLGLTSEDVESIVLKDYRHFKSYLPLLTKAKWLIRLLARLHLVPENIEKKLR